MGDSCRRPFGECLREVWTKGHAEGCTRVYLYGVMHATNTGAHDRLFDDIPEGPSTIILHEGTTLASGPVGGTLTDDSGGEAEFSWGFVERLGLTLQPDFDIPGVEHIHADLRVTEHSHNEEMAALITHPLDIIRHVRSLDSVEQEALQSRMKSWKSETSQARNDCLYGHILDAALTHDHIVVPWGDGHLDDIRERLAGSGWRVESSGVTQFLRGPQKWVPRALEWAVESWTAAKEWAADVCRWAATTMLR